MNNAHEERERKARVPAAVRAHGSRAGRAAALKFNTNRVRTRGRDDAASDAPRNLRLDGHCLRIEGERYPNWRIFTARLAAENQQAAAAGVYGLSDFRFQAEWAEPANSGRYRQCDA
jgi:hypothetical protein